MTTIQLPQEDDRQQQQQQESHEDTRPLHIVFIHLDLGIGGAEQLVLQLATASQDLGHRVDIVTTRCDQDHCFAAVHKAHGGRLADDVYVYGSWIPSNLFGGVATALMSTVRMLYLTYKVASSSSKSLHGTADVVVVDVLPTALPLLLNWMPSAGIIFYCHYPDKLLLRDASTASQTTNNRNEGSAAKRAFFLAKRLYRKVLDDMEERTMALADTLVVNSRFTLGQVQKHFPSLSPSTAVSSTTLNSETSSETRSRFPIEVLYPALDTSNMVQANNQSKNGTRSPIVSLNRFERKKNIGLLLRSYAFLKERHPERPLPPLVIAGGYDTKNVENVEYRGELGTLAKELGVPEHKGGGDCGKGSDDDQVSPTPPGHVEFRLDISDAERAELFQTALCVVYTPDKEHFGIVPLEAMFAATPVLAVNSGGPMETVVDGVDDGTGFLRESTPEAFGEALWEWIQQPEIATAMGRRGRKHVEDTFGTQRFETEWRKLVDETKRRSVLRNAADSRRRPPLVLWVNTSLYMIEAVLVLVVVLLMTLLLRWIGALGPSQSILGAVRKGLLGDEL